MHPRFTVTLNFTLTLSLTLALALALNLHPGHLPHSHPHTP